MDHRIVKLLVPILLVTFRQAEAVEVWIGEFSAVAGESAVVVPVEVSGAVGMAGGDLVITYEAAVLNAVAVESGDLSSAWLVSANLNGVGVIRVSMAGSQGSATATGSLLMLRFEVQPEVECGTCVYKGTAQQVATHTRVAHGLVCLERAVVFQPQCNVCGTWFKTMEGAKQQTRSVSHPPLLLQRPDRGEPCGNVDMHHLSRRVTWCGQHPCTYDRSHGSGLRVEGLYSYT